jgi:SAM-dependent methyltransferase
VLHFAIEKNLTQAIENLHPQCYVKADLFPKNNDITKMDCTSIPHPDNTFDVIICNHVLEHVPDYKKAMSEFFRVLKPGGSAILQVPLARLLKRNFEVKNTDTDELRNYFYEQKDHVRLFSEDQYLEDLANCGFKPAIAKSSMYFTQEECKLYGVNFKEDLICVGK